MNTQWKKSGIHLISFFNRFVQMWKDESYREIPIGMYNMNTLWNSEKNKSGIHLISFSVSLYRGGTKTNSSLACKVS